MTGGRERHNGTMRHMKGSTVMDKEVTRDEWIKAMYYCKYKAYDELYCSESAWEAHRNAMQVLDANPRLAESEFGKRYMERTRDIEYFFKIKRDAEHAIERMMTAGFGSASLKYWDPALRPDGKEYEDE